METPPLSKQRLVVLASGSGSNAQAIIDACTNGAIDAMVAGIVSDRPESGVLRRAAAHDIEHLALAPLPGESRHDYDVRLADHVEHLEPDHVVLLGWMRILSLACGRELLACRRTHLDLQVGKLFCLGFLKDLPFTLAAAGAKGSIAAWDTTEDSNVWSTFASRVSPEVAAPVESKQALTGM